MTQYKDIVKKRNEELEKERDMSSVTGITRVINKAKNIDYTTIYYKNGKQVRSYKDKRKKDEVIQEAFSTLC